MKKLNNGWYVPTDDERVTFLLSNDTEMLRPSYEDKYRQIIKKQHPNKRTFIDVGANVGIWSLPMSRYFQKTIAYEPSRQNIECLKLNVPKTVEIQEKAVANFCGKAAFHQAGKNCGDGKLIGNMPFIFHYDVNVVTLDSENLTDVDMVKIDTQGWELQVLQGMTDLMTIQRPWVMIEINTEVDICCALMEKLDYEMVYIKSKRNILWAPKTGLNRPLNKEILKRYLGPGPYAPKYAPN